MYSINRIDLNNSPAYVSFANRQRQCAADWVEGAEQMERLSRKASVSQLLCVPTSSAPIQSVSTVYVNQAKMSNSLL